MLTNTLNLTAAKLGPVVTKIVKDSNELKTIYFESTNDLKDVIVKNIKNDYIELCEFLGRTMPVDEYIEDKELSGGWNWVVE